MAQEATQPRFKRYDPRINVSLPVKLEKGSETIKVLTLDLSRGGLSVTAQGGIEAKDEVSIALDLPGIGGVIHCRGQVMRIEEGRAGVRFIDLSKEDLVLIERFILFNIRMLFVGWWRRFLLRPKRVFIALLAVLCLAAASQVWMLRSVEGEAEALSNLMLGGMLLLAIVPAYLAANLVSYLAFPFSWREFRLYKGLGEADVSKLGVDEEQAEKRGVSSEEMKRIVTYYGAARQSGGVDAYRVVYFILLFGGIIAFLSANYALAQEIFFRLFPSPGGG